MSCSLDYPREGWYFSLIPFSEHKGQRAGDFSTITACWEQGIQVRFDTVTSNVYSLRWKTDCCLFFWYFQFQVSGHPSAGCKHSCRAAVIYFLKSRMMLFPRNSFCICVICPQMNALSPNAWWLNLSPTYNDFFTKTTFVISISWEWNESNYG